MNPVKVMDGGGANRPAYTRGDVPQFPTGVVKMFNSDIFALFVLVQLDSLLASKIFQFLQTLDGSSSGKIKVQDFANKYGGKQKYSLPVLYLLFFRHFDRVGKDNAAYDLMHQNAVVQLLASAAYDVYAPYFLFLCFLFQFLTVDEGDFIEYLFWLLTKGERTLDRGDIAMLLQLMLGEKKDSFVTQHKDTIEKIFLEQGSEAIVLNRLQVINASLSGIFTRILKELQASLLQNLFGSPKLYKELLVKISKALYTHQEEAYNRIRLHKHLGANRTIVQQRKEIRKTIRIVLRLMKSYWHLKENTTLMFKNNGVTFAKLVKGFFNTFTGTKSTEMNDTLPSSSPHKSISSTGALQGLQQASELAKMKKKKQSNSNPVISWIDENILHSKTTLAKKKAKEEEELLLKEMAELPDETLDPFKFEQDFAYALEMSESSLFHEVHHTRKQAHRNLEETSLLLEEMQDEMNMTFESLGLSVKHNRQGSMFSLAESHRSASSRSMSSDSHAHHLPVELLERKARLEVIHETLQQEHALTQDPSHQSLNNSIDDEEEIMRVVQNLGRKYEQTKKSTYAQVKAKKRRSIFGSLSFQRRSSVMNDDDASSDEDLSQRPIQSMDISASLPKSALVTDSAMSKKAKSKKTRHVSIVLDGEEQPLGPEHHSNDDSDDDQNLQKKSGSRKKAALMSDIEQAKSMEKLSGILSHSNANSSNNLSSSSKKRPFSGSGSEKLPDAGNNNNAAASTKGGNSAFSRLNQWKASRGKPKSDQVVEAESHQIDELRDMLMVDAPDDDALNAAVNEALNEQFQSPEGLTGLLAGANLSDVTQGASVVATHGKTATILATKDEHGRLNLTDEQRFAYDAYNYEQDFEKKMNQQAYMSIMKSSKK